MDAVHKVILQDPYVTYRKIDALVEPAYIPYGMNI